MMVYLKIEFRVPSFGFRVSGLKLAPSAFTTAEDYMDILFSLFVVAVTLKKPKSSLRSTYQGPAKLIHPFPHSFEYFLQNTLDFFRSLFKLDIHDQVNQV